MARIPIKRLDTTNPPYVTRSAAHKALIETLDNDDPSSILIAGRPGAGVSRTLLQFIDLIDQKLFASNPRTRTAIVTCFLELQGCGIPEMLVHLRNELVRTSNAAGYDSSHAPFRDFDLVFATWCSLEKVDSTRWLPLTPSKQQEALHAAGQVTLCLLISSVVGVTKLAGHLAELLELTAEKAVKRRGRNIEEVFGRWARNQPLFQGSRVKAFLRTRPTREATFVAFLEETFIEGASGVLTELAKRAQTRVFAAFDALDEYDVVVPNGPPLPYQFTKTRGAACIVIRNALAGKSDIALGGRADIPLWRLDLGDLAPRDVLLDCLSKSEVESAWSAAPTVRRQKALKWAFPGAATTAEPWKIVEAWERSET